MKKYTKITFDEGIFKGISFNLLNESIEIVEKDKKFYLNFEFKYENNDLIKEYGKEKLDEEVGVMIIKMLENGINNIITKNESLIGEDKDDN